MLDFPFSFAERVNDGTNVPSCNTYFSIFIIFSSEQADLDSNSIILGDNNTRCGADTFMLRDSVCDEATNTEICLFDGGDCCLEIKDRSLCRDCSCNLTVDMEELKLQFTDFDIKPLYNPTDFDQLTFKEIIKVEEVISGPVCAVFCLKSERDDTVNAWRYDESEQLCQCSWVESVSCPEDRVDTEWTFRSLSNWTLNAYVQLRKSIPCGR